VWLSLGYGQTSGLIVLLTAGWVLALRASADSLAGELAVPGGSARFLSALPPFAAFFADPERYPTWQLANVYGPVAAGAPGPPAA